MGCCRVTVLVMEDVVSRAESRDEASTRGAPRKSLQPLADDHTSTTRIMAVLSFSLTPEATGRIYEALVCLAKFGESVVIEARGDKVRHG